MEITLTFFWILTFALSVSVHEASHALSAYLLGDPTAKYEGRISLNPLKHLDISGLLFLLIVHFGWAKPVPINPKNFSHPRLDMALVAAAGPLSNILLAILTRYIWHFTVDMSLWVNELMSVMFLINIFLAVFNLLPIFPLDGEKILRLFIPQKFRRTYNEFYPYGPLLLFGLLGVQFIFGIRIFEKILVPMANYLATFVELFVFFT